MITTLIAILLFFGAPGVNSPVNHGLAPMDNEAVVSLAQDGIVGEHPPTVNNEDPLALPGSEAVGVLAPGAKAFFDGSKIPPVETGANPPGGVNVANTTLVNPWQ